MYNNNKNKLASWLHQPFIERGYRVNLSYLSALKSIFYLHNETINIWTHLIASIICLFYMGNRSSIYLSMYLFESFITSSFFHTFLCCSESVNKFCSKCDYIGILLGLLFCSASMFIIYFGNSMIFYFYSLLICSRTVGGIVLVVNENFMNKHLRILLLTLFSGIDLVAFLNFLYYQTIYSREILGYFIAWNISATICYKFYIPERLILGRFDIIGNSHNILHISVMIVVLLQQLQLEAILMLNNFKNKYYY